MYIVSSINYCFFYQRKQALRKEGTGMEERQRSEGCTGRIRVGKIKGRRQKQNKGVRGT